MMQQKIGLFCRAMVSRFNEVDGTGRAAALTYTSLLALVPLMVVSFNVLLLFSSFKNLGAQVQAFVFANFVPETGLTIQSYLQTIVQQATQLSWISLAFLLLTSVFLFFSMEQTFNKIWRVPRQRHSLVAFFIYCAAIGIVPVLVGLSLALTSQFFALPVVIHTLKHLHIGKIFLYGIPFLFTVLGFTVLYYAVPNRRVPVFSALLGGVFAAILFELAKLAFSLYIDHLPTYKLVYGALAAIPVFLLWMYISWLIVLIGGVLSCVVSEGS